MTQYAVIGTYTAELLLYPRNCLISQLLPQQLANHLNFLFISESHIILLTISYV